MDDLFVGSATEPRSLAGLCDDIDVVISSLGVTRQSASRWAVDYKANRTILDLAMNAGVDQFIFVSVAEPQLWEELIKPRERLVSELEAESISHVIVRPTGYFSDMTAVLRMAERGLVVLVGDGRAQVNPIHGSDLAAVCADAIASDEETIHTGGPETMSYNEIATVAFDALEQSNRVIHIPERFTRATLAVVRPVHSRYYGLGNAFTNVMTTDVIAPETGSHRLGAYYESVLQRDAQRDR
ncbi:NADH dehydrogenase 32K subunit-like protein [Natrialba chahannaoensis JCM 10990]|uniref:Divinyl chlorophyllide a 8-vinyl-reductase, chloroplastic n=1 Tax=Natrialba chahannaoensis JCM 10990 TaxID=1227492 RepID=M0B7G2_9EURY|nr:NADH dehydrogenase 32K subunit-like protein [Natrialba chahannaoensis JCM 10990]